MNDVQRWAGRPGHALFDTLVVFENYPVDEALRARTGDTLQFGTVANLETTHYSMTVRRMPPSNCRSRSPMTLHASRSSKYRACNGMCCDFWRN